MNTVVIDGTAIHSREELHSALASTLEFPDYYGKNLSALWDCLTGWVSTPLTVVWENYQETHQALGDYAEKVVELFFDASKEVGDLHLVLR